MTETDEEIAQLFREARISIDAGDDKYYVDYRQFMLLREAGGRIVRWAKEGLYLDIEDEKGRTLRFVHACLLCPHESPTTYFM